VKLKNLNPQLLRNAPSNKGSIGPQGGTLLDAGAGSFKKDHRLDGARSAQSGFSEVKHDIMGSQKKAMLE